MLCLCLSLVPGEALAAEVTSGSCGEGLTWVLEDGTLTISGSGDMAFESQPWFLSQQEIEKVVVQAGVTSIADHAFSGCWPLNEISLPNGLTAIGAGAFSGSGLKEIDLPASVTTIGESAFAFCGELEEITIPTKVTALEKNTFTGCHDLTVVNLPENLTAIGDNTFSGCGMIALELPDSVTTIGAEAFSLCEALMDITMPKNLVSLGDYAFSGCISLETIILPDTLTAVNEGLFYNCHLLDQVTLPKNLISLGDFAFSDCSSLSQLNIPQGTRTIGEGAFTNCSALEAVTLPETLTSISTKAFINCSSLSTIHIPQGISYLTDSTFEGCESLSQVELPNSLTEIGDRAFAGCAIEELTIPKNVTKIGEAAFKDNASLRYLYLPMSINRILGSAFAGCSALTDVYFPGTQEDAQSIWMEELNDFLQEATWHYSHNAHTHEFTSTITAPSCTQEGFTTHICACGESYTDTFVDPYGHDYQQGLCQICRIPMAPFGDDLSWGLNLYGKLTISGTGAMPDFSSMKETPWYADRSLITEVVLENGVTTVGDFAFSGCSNLGKVTLPEGVTRIGFCGFSSCGNLPEIILPQTLTSLGKQAFYGCHSLTSISIPSGVSTIGTFTFYGCGNLKMVTLPLTVTAVGEYAFSGCSALETVNYEGTATDKGNIALSSNNQPLLNAQWYYSFSYHIHEYFPTVTPPTCASSGYTTYACECGEKYLDEFVPATGEHDFLDGQCSVCQAHGGDLGTDITWLLDTEGILHIRGEGEMPAFINSDSAPWAQYAEDVTMLVIHEGITSVSDSAFEGLENLMDASLPDSLITIGDKAFTNTGLTFVYIPKGVTEIGKDAFRTKEGIGVFVVDDANTAFADVDNVLLNKEKTVLLQASVYTFGKYLVPETVEIIGEKAFAGCQYIESIIFQNSLKTIEENAFDGCDALVKGFYTGSKSEWENITVKDATISDLPMTFDHKLGPDVTKYTLIVPSEDLGNTAEVWVDGAAYAVEHYEGNGYIQLPDTAATNMTVFTYNKASEDVHEVYPTGMKVWMLSHESGSYTARYIPEFDDMLQYAGSSIRIVGKKGIRMITSIPEAMKKALTDKGLAGFTLVEYGTALAWKSDLENGPLVLGASYTKSNYAYKKGVADPVFSKANGKVSYTNVLVGFTNDQCKDDIAMRPYIILKDASGNQVTIYGGMVYRSIGYIAWQNRTAFKPKTNAYDFVWSIIHHVYGDQYDADYKG